MPVSHREFRAVLVCVVLQRAIVQEVDPEHSDEEIIALFKKADNDGSGIIDFDEFHAAVLESHTDDDSKTLDLQELVSSV